MADNKKFLYISILAFLSLIVGMQVLMLGLVSPESSSHVTRKASVDNEVMEDSALGLKICRIQPTPQLGTSMATSDEFGLPLWYQCTGQPYDDFMTNAIQLVENKYINNPSEMWGRRPSIVPSSSKHRSILIMGNSHTRQLAASLLCQNKDQIIGQRKLIQKTMDEKHVGVAFDFINNLTISVIANHPFAYSKQWLALLEKRFLRHPLSELDAIVLGKFNGYNRSRNTTFLTQTLQYQDMYPDQGVDIKHNPPPNIQDVAKVYSGPLIWVGMFALYSIQEHEKAVGMVKKLTASGRLNVRSVNGRSHIKELGGECSSNSPELVSTCEVNRSNFVYSNGHKCVGDKGGQPDLIAWDVIEVLHGLLSDEALTTQ